MNQERDQRIRERAYAIWEGEGRPADRHEEHWRQACDEIDQEDSNPSQPSAMPGTNGNASTGSDPSPTAGTIEGSDETVGADPAAIPS